MAKIVVNDHILIEYLVSDGEYEKKFQTLMNAIKYSENHGGQIIKREKRMIETVTYQTLIAKEMI